MVWGKLYFLNCDVVFDNKKKIERIFLYYKHALFNSFLNNMVVIGTKKNISQS